MIFLSLTREGADRRKIVLEFPSEQAANDFLERFRLLEIFERDEKNAVVLRKSA